MTLPSKSRVGLPAAGFDRDGDLHHWPSVPILQFADRRHHAATDAVTVPEGLPKEKIVCPGSILFESPVRGSVNPLHQS